MHRSLSPVWMLIVASAFAAGCRTAPKPPPPPVMTPDQQGASASPTDLRPYLAARQAGTWVYQRRDLREGSDRPVVQYVRHTTPERLLEGDTSWVVYRTLQRRLARGDSPDAIQQLPNPGGSSGAFVLRFALAEPMPLIPADLTAANPSVSTTRLDYADLRHQPQGRGSLTRTATVEGYEDVDCPAGRFENCLRVRVDLDLEIRWGPSIDWTMYLWLSPEVGDVKRVQRLSGWLLIFPFGSSFENELVSYTPPPTTQPSEVPPPVWKNGLVAFDRGIPSPSIGMLLVELDRSNGRDGEPEDPVTVSAHRQTDH